VFPVVGEELVEFRVRCSGDLGQVAREIATRVDGVTFGAGD
jgi:hypothetical protein